MIGLVIVAHSAVLAEAVCGLARQVARENVRLAAAGGAGEAGRETGTDAFRVREAIDSVYSDDGVLVLMDLGSAVLSAETALDLLDESRRPRVRLSAAPLVEGAVAAATLAAAGASLDEVAGEAGRASLAKSAQLGDEAAEPNLQTARTTVPLVQPDSGDASLARLVPDGGAAALPEVRPEGGPRAGPARLGEEAAEAAPESARGGAPRHEVARGAGPEAAAMPIEPREEPEGPACPPPGREAPEATRIAEDVAVPVSLPASAARDESAALAPPARSGEPAPWMDETATLTNPLGLHARPAAQVVRIVRRFRAGVTLRNVTAARGPADARSINGLLGLGARQGDTLEIRADGADCQAAVAAVVGFIRGGCGEPDQVAPARVVAPETPAHPAGSVLSGIAAAAGMAVGRLVKLRAPEPGHAAGEAADPDTEERRLLGAIRAAGEETRALSAWAQAHVGAGEAGIFDAQFLALDDPELAGEAARIIREEGAGAASAWESASARLVERFAALEDPYLRARAADMRDVAARVMRRLTGARTALPALGSPSILAAHDLAPSEVKELDPSLVLGLCLEMGSASAHSVILARAMGIPVVAGLGPALPALPDGTLLAMDGTSGSVWIEPGEDRIADFDRRRRGWLESRRLADADRKKPAATRDGHPIRVVANISGFAEAEQAVEYGADGVGVLRTEFLFLDRAEPPDESEQLAAYAAIAWALGGRPLVVRTLDIGGDKGVPYVDVGEEANPFLGWRGIRLTLDREDLLRTQLLAILRAGTEGPLEILLPMVSTLAELRRARAILAEAERDLARRGIPFRSGARLGVMIETPAAVAIADQLAREAAFFSIGSNDLIQYVMVADRTNARVAPMADPFQPAVLRMLRQAIDAGRQAGIDVALCGEFAADPLAAPLLIGLGLEELSVSAPLVPEVKQAIARWTVAEARRIAAEVLLLDSSEAVRDKLSALAAQRSA